MIEKMDKVSEQKVLDAVGSAIRLSNGAMSPDEAIAKSASDRGFGREYTSRVVEAFNVSKSLSHHKTAELDAKADDFPLADKEAVFAIMYPEDVQTPAEKSSELWCAEGTPSEDRFFIAPEEKSIKLASGEEVSSGDVDFNGWIKQAHAELEGFDREADTARFTESIAHERARGAIDKLASYFHSTPHESFERVEKFALAAGGDEIKPLMDLVWTVGHLEGCGEKRAAGPEQLLDMDRTAVRWLDEALEERGAVAKAAAETKAAYTVRNDYATRLRSCERSLVKSSFNPMTFAQGALADTAITRSLKAPDMTEALLSANEMLSDPGYEAERKSIGARRMLHKFMSSDEVLSKSDPQAVVRAYNELATIAPDSMESEGTARSLLRRLVEQGQMDPFEVSNIADLERKRQQSATASPELTQALGAPASGAVDFEKLKR